MIWHYHLYLWFSFTPVSGGEGKLVNVAAGTIIGIIGLGNKMFFLLFCQLRVVVNLRFGSTLSHKWENRPRGPTIQLSIVNYSTIRITVDNYS